jgi:hypothetical protein
MSCVPTVSVEVENVACPLASSGTVARVVATLKSSKMTVPTVTGVPRPLTL